MKKSKKVALCGMLSALSVVILLMAYFPYLTFALPAVAGALFMILLIELNSKWAFAAYVATSILGLILMPKFESTYLFVGFFGFFPIIKGYLENIPTRGLEYVVKFAIFNLTMVLVFLLVLALGMPLEGMEVFGPYTVWILLLLANLMFFVYDIALSRLYGEYFTKLHPRIARILK